MMHGQKNIKLAVLLGTCI